MPTHAKRMTERDEEHGGVAFAITKPVDLATLDREITEAMGWRNQAGLIAEGDPTTASPEEPVMVWVVRTDVDTNTVKKVVTAHENTPEETPWMSLVARAQDDEPFTDDEMREAMKMLVLRSARGVA